MCVHVCIIKYAHMHTLTHMHMHINTTIHGKIIKKHDIPSTYTVRDISMTYSVHIRDLYPYVSKRRHVCVTCVGTIKAKVSFCDPEVRERRERGG